MTGYLSGQDIEYIAEYQRRGEEITRLRAERDKALADCQAAITTRRRHEIVIDELREENERLRATLSELENSK